MVYWEPPVSILKKIELNKTTKLEKKLQLVL